MVNVVIPMAGLGLRFPKEKFYYPKPLIDINGKTMISRAIESLDIDGRYYFILRKDDYTEVIKNEISKIIKDPFFKIIDHTTEGSACSVLLLKNQINNDEELITANCDQIMEWDSNLFFHNVRLYDGAVVTYHSDTDKNSYVKLDRKGKVIKFAEKIVISNISLNGIHYWKKGMNFIDSVEEMIESNDRTTNGEFYIAPSYNYMIKKNLNVGIFHIPIEQHHAVGTPVDLEKYINYVKIRG